MPGAAAVDSACILAWLQIVLYANVVLMMILVLSCCCLSCNFLDSDSDSLGKILF